MRVILLAAWAVLFLGVAITAALAVRRSRARDAGRASWTPVSAVVTGHEAGWKNGAGGSTRHRRFFAAYEFSDATGAVVAGQSDVSRAQKPVLGSSIDVFYNPVDPRQSFQPDGQTKLLTGCLVPVFAGFGLVSFYAIWLITA